MPNALAVLVYLSHAVKRDSMDPPLKIREMKGLWGLVGKDYFLELHHDDSILIPVVVSQLKIPFGELRIPSNTVEELVNWDHVILLVYERCWISIFGSSTQVL